MATPAIAQEGEVVVTGRGLAARPGDAAVDVVTIPRERIAESASGRLESVLADVAGLQQFRRSDSRSANPTSQGVSLRGIGGNAASRALLILDGVPQADPFGGWVAFPAYAIGRLGQVRVTRGGGSGYLGPGALAGTIELDSALPGDLAPAEASAALGTRGAIAVDGGAALVRDDGFATLSAAYARGDGFVPVVAGQRGSADRPAPYEQFSAAARGVVSVAADVELQAGVSAFADRRERGTAFSEIASDGADASLRLVGRRGWAWSALAYLQTRSFASRFAALDPARTLATPTLDQYATPANAIGARIELRPPLGEGVELRIGVDGRHAGGRTRELFAFASGLPTRRREAGGAQRTSGVFADASATTSALTLTLGGRIDRWRIAGGRLREHPLAGAGAVTDTRFVDRDGVEATGRAGLAWRAGGGILLRVAGYRGWRLPTLNELYRPFRVGADATAADAGLRPERLTGIDGGIVLTPAAGLTLSATLFRDRLANAIANVTVGRGPGTFPGVGFVAAGGAYRLRANLDAIASSGVEASAHWRRGAFDATLSWSHVAPRVAAAGPAAALDGLRPAQTPRDRGSATLGWRVGGAALSATLRHAARQFEDDQNVRSLAPATTLDAFAALPVAPAIAVEFRGENLFDARVEAGVSAAGIVERAAPRTLWIGLNWRPRPASAR